VARTCYKSAKVLPKTYFTQPVLLQDSAVTAPAVAEAEFWISDAGNDEVGAGEIAFVE
jgi:hypothetical protein